MILILLSEQMHPLHKPAAKIKAKQLHHLFAYRYCDLSIYLSILLIL